MNQDLRVVEREHKWVLINMFMNMDPIHQFHGTCFALEQFTVKKFSFSESEGLLLGSITEQFSLVHMAPNYNFNVISPRLM